MANLGPFSWGSFTHQILVTVFLQFRPEGHLEPLNKVGSLSLAECLVGFELGNFQL